MSGSWWMGEGYSRYVYEVRVLIVIRVLIVMDGCWMESSVCDGKGKS